MSLNKFVAGYSPLEVVFTDEVVLTGGYTAYAKKWDFGDGFTSATDGSTLSITHTYTGAFSATYDASLTISAYDVTGGLWDMGTVIKPGYVTIWGPEPRWDEIKKINLVDYLPVNYKDTEVQTFLQFFEDFLNDMYKSNPVMQIEGDVSAANVTGAAQRISILEKVKRIAELHDPELIDIEYIQYFANYLGYDINLSRSNVPGRNEALNPEDTTDGIKAYNQEKYLRFLVSNLPNWYKIKTTNNAIKVLLFSFGLIADIVALWTPSLSGATGKEYEYFAPANIDNPAISGSSIFISTDELKKYNYYPTSHFALLVDLDESSSSILLETSDVNEIIKAIESVKPINTVFDNMMGWAFRILTSVIVETNVCFQFGEKIEWEGDPAELV